MKDFNLKKYLAEGKLFEEDKKDKRDEIANEKFDMGYDQLGPAQKGEVHDEIGPNSNDVDYEKNLSEEDVDYSTMNLKSDIADTWGDDEIATEDIRQFILGIYNASGAEAASHIAASISQGMEEAKQTIKDEHGEDLKFYV